MKRITLMYVAVMVAAFALRPFCTFAASEAIAVDVLSTQFPAVIHVADFKPGINYGYVKMDGSCTTVKSDADIIKPGVEKFVYAYDITTASDRYADSWVTASSGLLNMRNDQGTFKEYFWADGIYANALDYGLEFNPVGGVDFDSSKEPLATSTTYRVIVSRSGATLTYALYDLATGTKVALKNDVGINDIGEDGNVTYLTLGSYHNLGYVWTADAGTIEHAVYYIGDEIYDVGLAKVMDFSLGLDGEAPKPTAIHVADFKPGINHGYVKKDGSCTTDKTDADIINPGVEKFVYAYDITTASDRSADSWVTASSGLLNMRNDQGTLKNYFWADGIYANALDYGLEFNPVGGVDFDSSKDPLATSTTYRVIVSRSGATLTYALYDLATGTKVALKNDVGINDIGEDGDVIYLTLGSYHNLGYVWTADAGTIEHAVYYIGDENYDAGLAKVMDFSIGLDEEYSGSIDWATTAADDSNFTYSIPAVSADFRTTYAAAFLVQGSDTSVLPYDSTLYDYLSEKMDGGSAYYKNAVAMATPYKNYDPANGDPIPEGGVRYEMKTSSSHPNISAIATRDYFWVLLIADTEDSTNIQYKHCMVSTVKRGIGHDKDQPTNIPLLWTEGDLASCEWKALVKPFTSQIFTATTAEGYELQYKTLDATTVECRGLEDESTAGSANLVIPDSVSYDGVDYAVKSIGASAFYNYSGFEGNLVISEGITSIENAAFSGCSGFTGSLVIPASVTSIEDQAFAGCSGFTAVTNEAEVPQTIDSYVFYQVPITIPLYVPKSALDAYKAATGWQDFQNIQEIVENGTIFNATMNEGYELKYEVLDLDSMTVECQGLLDSSTAGAADLVIPDSVTYRGEQYAVKSIGASAFRDRQFTGGLTIPASVTSIGVRAFYNCGQFTGNLVIPEGVDSIGAETFKYCVGFTGNLVIPASVKSIEESAFSWCSGFTAVTNKAEVPQTITSSVFLMVSIEDIPLYVPEGSIAAYDAAAIWTNFYSIEAIVEEGTNTTQASAEADFTVWGAQRTAYVEATQDMEQVRIMDLDGRVVYSANVNAYSVMQVKMPQAGVYVLQAMMKDGLLLSQKVMINE